MAKPSRNELHVAIVGNKGEDAQDIFFEGMPLEEGLGRDKPWYGHSGWGHPNYIRKSAHRKTLLDIMTSFIPIENVKLNKRLTKIEDRPNAECSVLAGADGIKSAVRAHVLEKYPSQITSVYAGAYCYRAVIPISEAYEILGDLTDVANFYFGSKRSAITYRITGGEEFNYLLCVADSLDGWKVKGAVTETISHEAMMADFKGPGGFFHHFRTASYYRGRVTLVGDSAHASLPFQAAGAAQGLEDALVLSNVLAETAKFPQRGGELAPFIQAGLSAYDSVRRPCAQKRLEQAAEVGRMIFFQHQEAGDDMDKILPKLQQGRFN
uniref:Salicylate hydroxylase n=1 Tax=Gibberella subglutinans TaxID=42677 RepID=A0A0Y0KGE8_GIBSU|nr:salicylate hydroxylase [Fusarium subglutinans]